MTNYPVFKEQGEEPGSTGSSPGRPSAAPTRSSTFNQTYKADPEMGKLMATKDFRIALSLRDQPRPDQGVGVPRPRRGAPGRARAVASRTSPATSTRRSTPSSSRDEANKMLDGIGLTKKDAKGIRLLPSGKPATIEIIVVPAFGAWPDVAQLVAKDWEKVGIKTIVQIRERALHFKMRDDQRADDRDLERGHHRLPLHRQRQGRPAQLADPDPGAAVRRSGTTTKRQGRRGAAAARSSDRRARRHRRAPSGPTSRSSSPRSSSGSGRTTSTRSARSA